MVLFVTVEVPSILKMPPPKFAELAKRVMFVAFSVPQLEMPPPFSVTEFPERVLLEMLTVPVSERLKMPPPVGAELLEMVLFTTVIMPSLSFSTPPPPVVDGVFGNISVCNCQISRS